MMALPGDILEILCDMCVGVVTLRDVFRGVASNPFLEFEIFSCISTTFIYSHRPKMVFRYSCGRKPSIMLPA